MDIRVFKGIRRKYISVEGENWELVKFAKSLKTKPKVFSLIYLKAVIGRIMEEILKNTLFCETH